MSDFWWDAPKGQAGAAVATRLSDVALKNDQGRRHKLVAWRCLYADLPYSHYGDAGIGVWRADKRSRYNLTQGAIDSTHARIVTQRPRPQVLTVAGRWKLQRKAKLLQRWIDGEYERVRAFDVLSDMCQDALIYGTGLLKVTEHNDRCKVERVWVGDVWVDPREERYDCVKTLYQIGGVDRQRLIAKFPGHKKAIEDASMQLDDGLFPDMVQATSSNTHDLVTVVEAWRLGDGPGKPGRRVLACGSATLVDEPWEHDAFPFVVFRWARDPNRWYGQGMVERVAGIQSDLSEHTAVVQEAYGTFVPKYAIPRGSKVTVEKINDEVGQVVYYDGLQPPTVLSPPPISPDFLRREDMIAERLYRVAGVSELSAAAMKPAGINSGKGMLVYQDTETQRFLPQGRAYERASIDLANLLIYTAKCIAKRGKAESLTVYGGKSGLEIADFDKAMFDGDDEIYQIRTWPVSSLSNSITGKLEEVERLTQLASITDPKQIQKLLDLPDMEQYQDISMAQREAADRQIDKCLDGEQGVPSTYMDLPYAILRGDMEVCAAEIDGAEEDVLQLLRNFCGYARTLVEQQNAPEGAEQGGPETLGDPALMNDPMDPMAGMPPDPAMAMDPMMMYPTMMGGAPMPMPPDGGGMPV